jgi:undecaprenyl diphosphate synthase
LGRLNNSGKKENKIDSVAIIMDGNGRWAKKRGLPRTEGHKAGAKAAGEIVKLFREYGVHHLTLYAFSTENWKRPKEEVDALMELIYYYIDDVVIKALRKDGDLCVRFIGDKSALSEELRNKCIEAEKIAKDRPFVCNVALNYGGGDEIVHAVNSAIADGHSHITGEVLSRYLYTFGSPDPDLVIRTGGDFRISNFLLWQSAYSEFIILETLWPDFGKSDIDRCMEEFQKRHRRFGGLDPEDDESEAKLI